VSLHHHRQGLEVDERRRSDAAPIGGLGLFAGDDEIAELALGSLDRGVDHSRFLDSQDLRDLGHVGPVGKAIKALADDANRLPHLLDPDHVSIVGITGLTDRHLEIDFVVAVVRKDLPNIPFHAGATKRRSCQPPFDGLVGTDDTDTDGALLPDPVLGQQIFVLVDVGVETVSQLGATVEPPIRQLEGDSTDLHGVQGQPSAAVFLEEIENGIAFTEGIEERRDGADINGVGREPYQVRRQSLHLGEYHPDVGGARWNRDSEQLFHGNAEALVVGRRRHVVHPVGVRNALREIHGLEKFFGAAVEVADDRFRLHDLFTVELHLDPQHAVSRRVLGTEVDLHFLDVEQGSVRSGHAAPPSPSSASSLCGPPPGG